MASISGKSIRLIAFTMNTVGHQSTGLWTHPRDKSDQYRNLDYWLSLAQLLEEGLFERMLIADVLGVYDVYQGDSDAALRHAEYIFLSARRQKILTKSVEQILVAPSSNGHEVGDIVVYAQALIITDSDERLAREKHEDYRQHVNLDAALTLLSGWTGVDFIQIAPDMQIEYIERDAGHIALASFAIANLDRKWTVREAAEFISPGGRGPVLVGSPEQVANQLESWMDETGIDGFNLACAPAPKTFQDVVQRIAPEMQDTGYYRTSYKTGTLGEKLFRRGPHLARNHIGQSIHLDS